MNFEIFSIFIINNDLIKSNFFSVATCTPYIQSSTPNNYCNFDNNNNIKTYLIP